MNSRIAAFKLGDAAVDGAAEFIVAHHAKATPFVWTKSADEILARIARFAQRTLDFQAAPLILQTTRPGHSQRPLRTYVPARRATQSIRLSYREETADHTSLRGV